MRVQRAPRAADQPQQAPEGVVRRDPRPAAAVEAPPSGEAPRARTPFTAEVDLDLGRLADLPPEDQLAEVVVRLVAACHREGLADGGTALRVARPAGRGMAGARVDRALDLSPHAVGVLVRDLGGALPAAGAHTLTVVDARGARARAAGDWGLGGGIGVATLGAATTVVVSSARSSGLVLGKRRRAPLGLTVPDGSGAPAVVRALETVARSLEERTS